MAMNFELLKKQIKAEGKLTRDELFWLIDQMEGFETQMKKMEENLDDRLHKLEMEKSDHIPCGI